MEQGRVIVVANALLLVAIKTDLVLIKTFK